MRIIETRRLFMRPYNDGDFAALYDILSDPETMKYYPAPLDMRQTEEWIQRNRDRYAKDGYGLWAVILKETNKLVGDCGLIRQSVDGKSEVEVGYHVSRSCWSRGLATEAAGACKDYGFRILGLSRLISIIDPNNAASIRVAEKIGLTKEKESRIFGKNHSIYAVDAPPQARVWERDRE